MEKNSSVAQLSKWTDVMNAPPPRSMDRTEKNTSSMAQLSAWTEVMKNTKKPDNSSKKVEIPENDEYEEEFEDYEEEFEPAPPKVEEVKPIYREIKSKYPDVKESSKSQAFVENITVSHSLARSIADPRKIRIQRVLSSGVLQMQLERSTVLNLAGMSKYDYYLGELQKENRIQQVGAPSDAEIRDMEISTDEVQSDSKEVQFCFEDDTSFYNALTRIRKRSEIKPSTNVLEMEQSSNARGNLSSFLNKSSRIVEQLIDEESDSKANENSRDATKDGLLNSNSWLTFGTDNSGANELIRFRDRSGIKFSSALSTTISLIHPFPEDEREDADLKPFKVDCSFHCSFLRNLTFRVLSQFGIVVHRQCQRTSCPVMASLQHHVFPTR
jgi:hypothetical protein